MTQNSCSEPEELEIPRDGMNRSKYSEDTSAQDRIKNVDTAQDCDKQPRDDVQPKPVRSLSDTGGDNSGKKSKFGRYNVKRTLSESFALDYENVGETMSTFQSDHSISFPNDPLANVKDITKLSAIQTGTTLKQTDSVINVEEVKDRLEDLTDEEDEVSKFELSLNLEDAREVLKRSEGIEELDSPESIQKIDQEDCFSWEEDRLLLSFEHKESIREVESSEQQIHQSASNKQSCDTRHSGTDTESLSTRESDKTNVDKESSESVEKEDNASDIKKSPGTKAAVIKNKISSAFSGLKAKRASGSLLSSPTSDSSPPEMPADLRSSKFVQDDCGFPLAVFTKVRFSTHLTLKLKCHFSADGLYVVLKLFMYWPILLLLRNH